MKPGTIRGKWCHIPFKFTREKDVDMDKIVDGSFILSTQRSHKHPLE